MGGMNPHKKGIVVGVIGCGGGMHNPADHGIQQEIPVLEEPNEIKEEQDVGHPENLPKTD